MAAATSASQSAGLAATPLAAGFAAALALGEALAAVALESVSDGREHLQVAERAADGVDVALRGQSFPDLAQEN